MPAFDRQTALRDAPEVLRAFAKRADPALTHELMVFARCLFVLGERALRDCDAATVAAFLEPARGLDLYDTRQRMFSLLRELVPNPAFDVAPQAGDPEARRSARRLRRRWYYHELRRRSAARLAALSQADALRTERRSMPFYAALRSAFGDPTPDSSHFAPVVERVVAFLEGRPAPKVLDVACAYGQLLGLIHERVPSARLVGTDILSMPGRIVALGHVMPLRGASFDVVTSTSLLEHVVDPEALVREIARLVRPDGLVVAVTTSIHVVFLTRNPLSYAEGLLSTAWPDVLPPHHHLYEPLTPLTMPHHAFTRHETRSLFARHFGAVEVSTLHYGHLRKFGLESVAPRIPLLRHFGGQLLIVAREPRSA
jgi:2-polyprenyl-3-methyl-5-hydroxy-6-metoxy-1,4-benzoquinol methylase